MLQSGIMSSSSSLLLSYQKKHTTRGGTLQLSRVRFLLPIVLSFFLLLMNNVARAVGSLMDASSSSSSSVDSLLLSSSSQYAPEGLLLSSGSSSLLQLLQESCGDGGRGGGGRARIVSPFSSYSSSSSSLRFSQQQDNAMDWDAYHHPGGVTTPTTTKAVVAAAANNLQVALPLQPPPPPMPISPSFPLEESFLPNHPRTSSSSSLGSQLSLRKTGTTICGVAGRYYCVLGADTRATSSTTVADKRAAKLHPLARNVWAAGAGTSADLEHVTRSCHYQLKLRHAVLMDAIGNQNQQSHHSSVAAMAVSNQEDNDDDASDIVVPTHVATSVSSVCRILQNTLLNGAGNVQANLIVGGIDAPGGTGRAMLRALHPHGSMDEELQFTALGSGGLAAMGVLEQGFYRARLEHAARQRRHGHAKMSDNEDNDDTDDNDDEVVSLEWAIELVKNAIRAGIENDLGSGSQVDLCIMTRQHGTIYQRCAVAEEQLLPLPPPSNDNDDKNNKQSQTRLADAAAHGDGRRTPPAAESSLQQQARIVSLAPQQEIQAKEDLWTKVLGL